MEKLSGLSIRHQSFLHNVRERVMRGWFGPLALPNSIDASQPRPQKKSPSAHLGAVLEGAAAASAAAFANPCKASMGAFRVDLGNVSSDSSSDDGAVLGTMPYVAYL